MSDPRRPERKVFVPRHVEATDVSHTMVDMLMHSVCHSTSEKPYATCCGVLQAELDVTSRKYHTYARPITRRG